MEAFDNRGFSLLETLVAFTVAALSLAAILSLFSGATVSTVVGAEYGQAVDLAQSLLAGAAAQRAPDTGIEAQKFAWTVSVRPHRGASVAGPLALQHIVVDVVWTSRGTEREVRLQTLRPAEAPAQP